LDTKLLKGHHWELKLTLKSEQNIRKDVLGEYQTVERVAWKLDADFDKLEKVFKRMDPEMAEFLLVAFIGILETVKQSALNIMFDIKYPDEGYE